MKESFRLIQDFHNTSGMTAGIESYHIAIFIFSMISLGGAFYFYKLKKGSVVGDALELDEAIDPNCPEVIFKKALKGRATLSTFGALKTPVVLVDEKEVITWLNDTARANFNLSEGETFFLEYELKLKANTDVLTYTKSKVNYSVYVRLHSEQKMTILTFIPTDEKSYSSVTEVEGSLPLLGALNSAVERNKYLFTNSGIPLVIDNRLAEETTIDETVGEVISKTLKLAYDMSKNIKNTRVDYTLDEVDGTSCLQIDFKNQKKNDIRWDDSINREDFTLADAWGELELSLANRQGRVFIYDDEQSKGMSFQLMFENKIYEQGLIV